MGQAGSTTPVFTTVASHKASVQPGQKSFLLFELRGEDQQGCYDNETGGKAFVHVRVEVTSGKLERVLMARKERFPERTRALWPAAGVADDADDRMKASRVNGSVVFRMRAETTEQFRPGGFFVTLQTGPTSGAEVHLSASIQPFSAPPAQLPPPGQPQPQPQPQPEKEEKRPDPAAPAIVVEPTQPPALAPAAPKPATEPNPQPMEPQPAPEPEPEKPAEPASVQVITSFDYNQVEDEDDFEI